MSSSDRDVLKRVQITPDRAMTLKGEFQTEMKQDLIIVNPTNNFLAFKIKLTSSKLLKLRPSYGYINPQDRIVINLLCNILKILLDISDVQRLSIMCTIAPAKRTADANKFFKSRNLTAKSSAVWRRVIRVKFENPSTGQRSPEVSASEERDQDDVQDEENFQDDDTSASVDLDD